MSYYLFKETRKKAQEKQGSKKLRKKLMKRERTRERVSIKSREVRVSRSGQYVKN